MNAPNPGPVAYFSDYAIRLNGILAHADWSGVALLAQELRDCWIHRRQVFICGNGGSAGNAMHLANDFLYGVSKKAGSGLKVNALPANGSVVSCLANDEGYHRVFSLQLAVLAHPGDVLIVFSGSGNSPNIVEALEEAKRLGLRSYAVLGFSGGRAKTLADVAIHFPVEDMQISEDMQLIVGHMVMQWLHANQPAEG
jgi:D-sedoheptulose 7-phosphate isomerase